MSRMNEPVPSVDRERLCDEFAAELLLPRIHVREFLAKERRHYKKGPYSGSTIRDLATRSSTSIQAAARAVSRVDAGTLVVALHMGTGKTGSLQATLQALRVRWSTCSELCSSGVYRFKRIPESHRLFGVYSMRSSFRGRIPLDLPPLASAVYEVDFSPYSLDGRGFYLLVINLGLIGTELEGSSIEAPEHRAVDQFELYGRSDL
jgi:hypothetical protein